MGSDVLRMESTTKFVKLVSIVEVKYSGSFLFLFGLDLCSHSSVFHTTTVICDNYHQPNKFINTIFTDACCDLGLLLIISDSVMFILSASLFSSGVTAALSSFAKLGSSRIIYYLYNG